MASLFRHARSPRIVRSALKVALVVGTILNLINQGDAIVTNGTFSWAHCVLNYVVPYCVASYSAAKNQMAQGPGHG